MPSLPAADPCDPRPQLSVIERIEALLQESQAVFDHARMDDDDRSSQQLDKALEDAKAALRDTNSRAACSCARHLCLARSITTDAVVKGGIETLLGDALLAAMAPAGYQPSQN